MRIHRGAALITCGAAGLAVLALVYLSAARIPTGSLGLVSRNGHAISVLRPGVHFHRPFDGLVLVPAGPNEYAGSIQVRTREGASLAVPYRCTVDFEEGRAESLSSLAAGVTAGRRIDEIVSGILAEAASPYEAGGPGERAVAERLTGLGLKPGSLTLGAARAAAPAAIEKSALQAAWSPPPWGVLVIGIDSADWDLMTPLIEAGALPNLKALRDRGAWGTLRSMKPTLSPILWTTIATGRRPEDHGILDFLMKDPATGADVPISRLFRRVKALWNIASDFGIPNSTVGWWATWPAERVTGSMVTDRVAFSLFDLPVSDRQPLVVYPDSLAKEVSTLSVDVGSLSYDDLQAVLDVPQGLFERARLAISSPEGYRDPVSHLIKILANTQTYHNIAMSLLKRQRAGLALVYYEGLDEANHRFAQYMPPAMGFTRGIDPVLASAYGGVVSNFYRLQDRLVGELLAAVPADTVVMVLSDHGFANGKERPIDTPPDIEGTPGLWHTMDGVLIVAGPPIRPGHLQIEPDLLDVTPTLLALLGLPAALDMPGHPISQIFRKGAEPRIPPIEVASYEEIGEPLQSTTTAGSSPQDAEMIARLAALGYVQSGGSDRSPDRSGTPLYHINAGLILLSRHQLDRAQEEFSAARKLAPEFDQPLLGLAQVELARGRPAEALSYLEQGLRLVQTPQPVLLTRVAQVYVKAGQSKRGLAFLAGLKLSGRTEAFRLTALGMLHEGLGQPEEALAVYREALAIDPSAERALYGAYALLKKRGDLDALASLLQKSLDVESIPVRVRAANWLALTRELQGRQPEARDILAAALEKAPDDLMTLTNLGSMLVRADRAPEGLVYLDRAYTRRPKSFEVLVNLIVAHGKMGHLEEARRYFNEGHAVSGRPELYNAIAYACFLNGARKDAEIYLAQSLAIDAKQPDAIRLKEEMDRGGS